MSRKEVIGDGLGNLASILGDTSLSEEKRDQFARSVLQIIELGGISFPERSGLLQDFVFKIITSPRIDTIYDIYEKLSSRDMFHVGDIQLAKIFQNAIELQSNFSGDSMLEVDKEFPEDEFFIPEEERSWRNLRILIQENFSEGVIRIFEILKNIPAALLLLPRYKGYRIKAQRKDIQELRESEQNIQDLLMIHPALEYIHLHGENGIKRIQLLGKMYQHQKLSEIIKNINIL